METIGKHKNAIKNGNLLFFLKNLYTDCTQIQDILSTNVTVQLSAKPLQNDVRNGLTKG